MMIYLTESNLFESISLSTCFNKSWMDLLPLSPESIAVVLVFFVLLVLSRNSLVFCTSI